MCNKIISITILSLFLTYCYSQQYQDPSICDYTWSNRLATIDISKKRLPPSQYLLESLNKIHRNELGDYSSFLYFDLETNINDAVKNKIISILKNEWSFEELRYAWIDFIKNNKEMSKENLDKIFERTRGSFKNINYIDRNNFIFDSIAKPYKIKFEESIRSFKIPWYVVYIAAWLNIKEVIPILKYAQYSQSANFNQASVTLALAKFNDSKSLDEIHNSIKDFSNKNLFCSSNQTDIFHSILFIGTQESLSYTIDLIDTSKKCKISFDAHMTPQEIYGSAFIVKRLNTYIKNTSFHKIFKDEFSSNPLGFKEEFVTARFLMKIKQWLIGNKGNYEFSRENFFNTFGLNN